MLIDEYADSLKVSAPVALAKAGAITVCPRHEYVTIRIGIAEMERRAYAIATNVLKRDGTIEWLREDVVAAIEQELDTAADGVCPSCSG